MIPFFSTGEHTTIVEAKTTTVAERYYDYESEWGCLGQGKGQLNGYFTLEKWRYLRKAKFGIPVIIYLEDLNKMVETKLGEGIVTNLDNVEDVMKNMVWNPNY